MNIGAFRNAIDYAVDVAMPYLDEFHSALPDMAREVIDLRFNEITASIEEMDVNANNWHDDVKETVNRFVGKVIADIEYKRDNTDFVSDTAEDPYSDVVMDVYETFTDEVNEAVKSNFSFDEFDTIDNIIVTGVRLYHEQVCMEEMNEVIDHFYTYLYKTIMEEITDRYENGEL